MNQVKTLAVRALALCILFTTTLSWAAAPEYRAFWLDAFHNGFYSQAQVDALLGTNGTPDKGEIREANCNMVVVQVRRRFDVAYPSGVGEPYMPLLSPADFNALAALIKAAHDTTGGKQRVEVHCWSVAFKTGKGLVYSQHIAPPTGDLVNFDNYWPTRVGSTTGLENGDGAFDPGHPKALEYLVNTHMDLVNFQTTAGPDGTDGHIDGIHYDYIRFEGGTEGYNPTSIARYKARYGLTTEPGSNDALFRQWRRDQVSAFVRQMYAKIQKTKPWVKQSGAFVTWNPSPTSSTRTAFQTTRPYGNRSDGVYSDWDSWGQEGIVDMAIPMTYYNLSGSYPADWTRWINFEKDRKFDRHMIIGPGIYMNSLNDAITELLQTRTASPAGNYAHGFCCYSYAVPYVSGNWSNFKARLLADVTPEPAPIPDMPWKSTPTKGHAMGTVTFAADNRWADFTQVSISGPVSRIQEVDGTGFYAFIDLPPGSYSISASLAGYAPATTNVTIIAGGAETKDMKLIIAGPPGISSSPQSVTVYQDSPVTFSGSAAGVGNLYYQWRFNGQNVPGTTGTSYPIAAVSTNDAGNYDFVVTNAYGRATSEVAVLTVVVPNVTDRFIEHWKLAPGSRSYITSATDQRGMAYNPANGHLLIVNKPTPSVHVLDAATGNDLHTLNTTGVTQGFNSTFYLIMIGVADDGAVYACNMTSAASASTTPFKIYRWANDGASTVPTVAYAGDPVPSIVERWGDSFDVRGSGANTEIIAASRNGTYVAVFKTSNGTTFTPTAVNIAGATGGDFGLGVAFGIGNTFWGKATGRSLRLSSYDLSSGTGTVLRTHPLAGNIGPIGFSTTSLNVAGVSIETPDNLQLYDVETSTVSLVATNPFATDYDNPHGTGAVDFAPGKVFALSTANGLLAMRYAPRVEPPVITADPSDLTVGLSQDAEFSVTAVGIAPLSYQWYFGSGAIADATGSSYTRENAQAIHEGSYTVVVTNTGGAVTSSPALLTVVLPPEFAAPPQTQTVIEGASVTFQVTMATEDPSVSYQWLFNGATLAAATRDTHTIESAGSQHAGEYRVVASNLGGSTTSVVATLTVLLRPAITGHPQNRTNQVGTDAPFSVSANGSDPLSYQWLLDGAEISGATANNYTRPAVVNTDSGGYSVVVTNLAGKATSQVATLSVSYPSAPSVEAITKMPDQKVSMSFNGGPGRFVVEASPDLFTWTNKAVINATNFGFTHEESTGAAPKQFYRIKREP